MRKFFYILDLTPTFYVHIDTFKKFNILYSDILQKHFIVTSAGRTYHTITAYTTDFLRMNRQVQNRSKTSKLKIKILI